METPLFEALDRRTRIGFVVGVIASLVISIAAVRPQGPEAPDEVDWTGRTSPTLAHDEGHAATHGPRRGAAEPLEAAPAAPAMVIDFAGQRASLPARRLAGWIAQTRDNDGRFFAIVDKQAARVHVFEPGGRMLGSSPVLLGSQVGDDSVPGVGDKPIAQVRPDERTTPAGRFVVEPGRNANGEDVIWVDYENAVSMHRVRTTVKAERRLQRLATATVADNRISYGCINVPVAFYNGVVGPALGRFGGVVYVLPEVHGLEQVFGLRDDASSGAMAALAPAATRRRGAPMAAWHARADTHRSIHPIAHRPTPPHDERLP